MNGKIRTYPIGNFHIDKAEVRIAKGDSTSVSPSIGSHRVARERPRGRSLPIRRPHRNGPYKIHTARPHYGSPSPIPRAQLLVADIKDCSNAATYCGQTQAPHNICKVWQKRAAKRITLDTASAIAGLKSTISQATQIGPADHPALTSHEFPSLTVRRALAWYSDDIRRSSSGFQRNGGGGCPGQSLGL